MRFLLSPRDFLVALLAAIVLLFQLTYTAAARADDADESQARAALSLAKAKREREAIKAKTAALSCHTDLDKATKEAELAGKPLAIWAGVRCADYPELRKALDGAVHCHIDESRHKHGKAVVIKGGDGTEFFVKPEDLKKDNIADKIKAKWSEPWVPPIRGDVVISEELSRFVYPAQQDYVSGSG